ncbi:sigma-70 family RNA polymerase sigma factor [Mycobacterium sp. 236(2023)]|uniref:sigma-70 family RNA polymerase sigma factor n=1 Tax=Mycobacterium sp. 236(2023) TaxID=3038163 RepID=UPI0024152CF7|nr:sigma-70 family RNA polymerase sigma factor [Mycobacterium sp. 236(2023)]MDG4665599.1 sigma-70 family RNA polymerase sigma factor [Mycobacterium sp. 236(2023)]
MMVDNPCASDDYEPSALARRFVVEVVPMHAELMRAARRYAATTQDAEDLVQDTYVKAWSGFASFQEGSNLRAWMFRILVNAWISTHRRSLSRPSETFVEEVSEIHSAAHPSAESEMLSRVVDGGLTCAVQALPQNLQAVVYYAYVCDLPFKEIAVLSDVPVGTVMSRAHRARRELRAALSDETATDSCRAA